MRAGELRHRITIQTQTVLAGTYGAGDITWADDIEVWAAMWPIKGNEYYTARQIESAVTHKFRLRYTKLSDDTRISPKCRIRYGDDEDARYFNIQAIIDPDERHIFLDIMAVEDV